MLVKMAWRNLWRNKLRTSIMLGAMMFGLMSVVASMGFMNGIFESMVSNGIKWQTSHMKVHDARYPDDPDIGYIIKDEAFIADFLDNSPTVVAWTGRHLVNGMIASARSTRGITVNGIDLASELAVTPLETKVIDGEWMDEQGRNPIMVSAKTAERLNLRVGSKVVITFSEENGDVTGAAFRVRGIYKTASTAQDDANVYVRKSDLQKISKVDGIHEIAMILDDKDSSTQLMLDLQNALQQKQGNATAEESHWTVRDWLVLNPFLKTSMQSMAVFNIVFVLIFVIAMSFGIVNILLMSVFERTREFGVLMAVGMVKGKIRRLIVMEATFLGFVGAFLGLIASIVAVAILGETGLDLTSLSAGIGDFGIDTILYPTVTSNEYFFTFIAVVMAALLSGLYPARQILKQRPVDAMSEKH